MNNTSIASSAIVASTASSDLDFPASIVEGNVNCTLTTLRTFVARLRNAPVGPKASAGAWSPAKYLKNYRNGANVIEAYAVGFDVDVKSTLSADELRGACAKFAGLFHSTSSHTPDVPRWRVVLLLSRPVTAGEYTRVWRALASELPFSVEIGREAKDASRQWFFPTRPTDDGAHVFVELDGERVDVDAILATEPEIEEESADLPAEGSRWLISDGNIEDAAGLLARHFVDGQRNAMSLEIAGACAWSGLSQADACKLLCRVAELGPEGNEDAKKRANIVRRTYVRAATGARVSGWPSLEKRIGPYAKRAKDVLLGADVWRAFVASRSRAANDDVPLEEEPQDASGETEEANPLGVVFGGLDTADAPIEYLVDGIIPKASVCMFVAEPYTLKTFAALDVAVSVAHGTPWLGKHATKKGRVVYVNFEMHGSELKRRLRLLGDDGGLVGRVTHPDLSLEHEEFWAALAELSPDLVVVDTLSAGNPNVEEKDPRAAEPLRRAAKMANDTNCTFLFVHHTTKDASASKKSRVRGTGAIFGALDACYFFESVGTAGASAIECIKMRSGPEPAKFVIKLSDSTGLTLDHSPVARVANTPDALDDAILSQLRQGPKTKDQLQRALEKRHGPIKDRLTALKEAGKAIDFDRAWHADGAEQRKARIVAAIRADAKMCTAKQVADAAHVRVDDVKKLEKAGDVWKTSTTDGTYCVRTST